MTEPEPEWLKTEEVAALIRVPPGTVSRWRKEGKGPKYSRTLHQVRYRRADVDAWMQKGIDEPAVERGRPA